MLETIHNFEILGILRLSQVHFPGPKSRFTAYEGLTEIARCRRAHH